MECQVTEYPTQAQHEAAWKKLAESIVDPALAGISTEKKGELIILGSGIETLGFIANDMPRIEAADVVFYCVADPGTVTWIKTMRPDAYDLYVLYGEDKVRYTTYMQMTEAMLSPVRQGQKVVAIYYGHPGIFALSPHRAILLARREGHKAIMRPGISALDCLCADLGIDPAHPGLQTYEATDMLIRRRIPDSHLHLVLWQVGLIGEMGFRHQGYLNQKFAVLLEYLQSYYGESYPIIHYIASRYPTISPVIEHYTLKALYDPKKQLKITGISTFYIPPKHVASADLEMLARLGLLKGKNKPIQVRQPGPLREIGQYGPRERKAFTAFKQFTIPRSYHWQKNTVASRFLIALMKDHGLQEIFRSEPLTALAKFPDLTQQERFLLASREANSIQIAAKGLLNPSFENEKFLHDLFFKNKIFTEIARSIHNASFLTFIERVQKEYHLDWQQLQKSLERLLRLRLSLWNGIYFSSEHDCLITIQGGSAQRPERILRLNGQPIKQFTFINGLVEWSKQEGVDSDGCLRFDVNHRGQRCLIGAFYQPGQQESTCFFRLPELQMLEKSLYALVGRYRPPVVSRTGSILEIKPMCCASSFRKIVVLINGMLQMEPIDYDANHSILYIGDQAFPLAINGKNLPQGWRPILELGGWYTGSYELTTRTIPYLSHNLDIKQNHIKLNNTTLLLNQISLKSIAWKNNPVLTEGILNFYLNPINLQPYGVGKIKTSSGEMQSCYASLSPPEKGLFSVDYHHLFAISPTAWRILSQQCAQFTAQDSFLFWAFPLKIVNSIKMLDWLLKKQSIHFQ